MNPFRNQKSGTGNPPPTAGAPALDPLEQQRFGVGFCEPKLTLRTMLLVSMLDCGAWSSIIKEQL